MATLAQKLEQVGNIENFPLVVVADDAGFTSSTWNNFLWVVFTRSDPATDIYGIGEFVNCKHFGATKGIVIDARLKPYHPPVLEDDPEVEKRVDKLGERGGPLYGII